MDGYSRREKIRITVKNTTEESEHFHQDIELLYVMEGALTVTAGEKTTKLEQEDILVINANKKHSLQGTADVLYLSLSITYQLVSDIFQSVDIFFWCDSTKEENQCYDELRAVLKQLLSRYLSTNGGIISFGHISLCYKVMDLLAANFLVQTADKEYGSVQERFDDRITQINNYIRANYNQPISLKELSEKLYLSHGYLSRFFKKNYGMSFAEYLENIRLYHAVDELLYTETAITRIAYDNGFSSIAAFNKAFKKAYGETPSTFRRKSEEQKADRKEEDEVIQKRLEEFLAEEDCAPEESPVQDRIFGTCSLQNREELTLFWNGMINAGAAEELLKSEVREHVALLKQKFGFRYLRFWNIFSEAMLIDLNQPEGNYNFSRLDSVLDFILKQGMRPHIELGLKPRRIHRTVQNEMTRSDGAETYPDWQTWGRFLDRCMRHLTSRYGIGEIDRWRMELWWDERLLRDSGGTAAYFALFGITYESIRRYSQKLKIGGCGYRIGYETQLEANFFSLWAKETYQPDFISMIQFAYVRGEEEKEIYSKRDADNDAVLHRLQNMKGMLERAGFGQLPLYISEWNLTISDRNYMNDTSFKGAYIVKNLLDIYGMADEVGYFTGSDRISEYYDSTDLLHGGTGLLTKDGILKPAGFAFQFLNSLYPYLLGKGENYLVTAGEDGSCAIICHNQKRLNYNYYFTKEDEIEKEHIWKYFEEKSPVDLEVKLNDLENGMYRVKYYRINEKNGSILDIWKDLEWEKELSHEDISYLKHICEPYLSIKKTEVKNSELTVDIRLAANEIAYVRIEKII